MRRLLLVTAAVSLTACAALHEPRPEPDPKAPESVPVTPAEFYVFCAIETVAKAVHHTYVLDACLK